MLCHFLWKYVEHPSIVMAGIAIIFVNFYNRTESFTKITFVFSTYHSFCKLISCDADYLWILMLSLFCLIFHLSRTLKVALQECWALLLERVAIIKNPRSILPEIEVIKRWVGIKHTKQVWFFFDFLWFVIWIYDLQKRAEDYLVFCGIEFARLRIVLLTCKIKIKSNWNYLLWDMIED